MTNAGIDVQHRAREADSRAVSVNALFSRLEQLTTDGTDSTDAATSAPRSTRPPASVSAVPSVVRLIGPHRYANTNSWISHEEKLPCYA
jgi:hypothetical protein